MVCAHFRSLPGLLAAAALLVFAGGCGGGQGARMSVEGGGGIDEGIGLLKRGEVPAARDGMSLDAAISEIEAQAVPAGVSAATFNELRGSLINALQGRGVTRVASSAPTGLASQVKVLAPLSYPGGVQFFWEEANAGDYDRNGEVNINDLTPLASYLGTTSSDAQWETAKIADGDSNGEVNMSDLTAIAGNYLSQVAGYNIYRALAGGSGADLVGAVSRADALHADEDSVLYSFAEAEGLTPGETYIYEVRPFSASASMDEGVASLPLEVSVGGSFGVHAEPVGVDSVEIDGLWRDVLAKELLLTFVEAPSVELLFKVIYEDLGASILGQLDGSNTYRILVAESLDIASAMASAMANTQGAYTVEYDYTVPQLDAVQPSRSASYSYADPERAGMWNLDEVYADAAWDFAKGAGVTVAVIDSGLETAHEDIAGQYLTGVRYGGADAWSDDTSTHGTHVAGTIGAAGGNSKGIVGLAPACKILPIRAGFPYNGGWSFSSSDLTSSVNYAVANGAKVINMSLGGQGTLGSSFETSLTNAEAAGVVVVAAAGNSNMDAASFYPASYPTVFSVGAVGPSLARASYSNYGTSVDICAPGGDIQTAYAQGILSLDAAINTGYSYKQGTSMACPHVAAMCALVLSANAGLSPAEVRSAIQNTGRTVTGTGGTKPVGKMIDAQAALLQVATFSVSGTVKRGDNTGVSSISITMSDGVNSFSATSGAGGAYTISGASNGTYTITPVRTGWTFTPATISVTVNNGSVTGQNFVANQTGITEVENNDAFGSANNLPAFPFSASEAGGSLGSATGYVAYDGDTADFYKFTLGQASRVQFTIAFDALKGNMNMALLGTNGTTQLKATTGTAGSKSIDFTLNAAGTYYLRCYRTAGYGDYSLAGVTTPAFPVTGTVTMVGGAPLVGASMTLASASVTYTVKTVTGGAFTFPLVANGAYTLSAASTGRTFTPSSQSVTVADGAVSGQDFVGEGPFTVGGTVTMVSGLPLASCSLTLSDGTKAYTALSGSTGIYSVKGVPNGSYTLTPTSAGRTFTPASMNITVTGGNLTGKDFVGEGPFTVGGKVTTVAGANLGGATFTLSDGARSYVGKSLSTGLYTVAGVPNGSYTLTPSMAGRTFTPATTSVTVASGAVTGNDFVAEGPFTVAGAVTNQTTGLALASVKLTLTGSMGTYTASTNTLGLYTVAGVPNGTYTLTPSRAGYGFSSTQSITIASGSVAGKDFTGFNVYSIGGRVYNGSLGVAGVLITVTDGSTTRTATTGSTGYYTVTGVPNGTWVVTPSGGGGSFTPGNRTVLLSGANVASINFSSP